MNKILHVLVLFLVACGQNVSEVEQKKQYEDGLGRKVIIDERPKKVIGLSPTITEMLFFITEGKNVIARTQNDTYPASVKRLPVIVNYPKLDMESLITYKPNLVFAEVGISPEPELRKLEEYGVKVFWIKANTIEELFQSLDKIAAIMEVGKSKVQKLKEEVSALEERTPQKQATALVLASISPMYVHGQNTLMTEKLEIAGYKNAVTKAFPGDYPEISREYLLELNPEYILGFSFGKMDSTYFTIHPEMKRLKAYQQRKIYALTSDLASRSSPRIVEAIVELKTILEK